MFSHTRTHPRCSHTATATRDQSPHRSTPFYVQLSPSPRALCVCAFPPLPPLLVHQAQPLPPLSPPPRRSTEHDAFSCLFVVFTTTENESQAKAKPKPSQSQAKALAFVFPSAPFVRSWFHAQSENQEDSHMHRANKAARDDRTGSGFSKTPHKFLPSFLGFVFFHIPDAFAVCTILFHLKPLLLDTKKRERESAHHHIARRSCGRLVLPPSSRQEGGNGIHPAP